LLFENNGTQFPLLINAFGSDRRLQLALGTEDPGETGRKIEKIFNRITGGSKNIFTAIAGLPELLKITGYFPSKLRNNGHCQQVVLTDPDLGILPVLKCWPFDGGRYITLPVVHTMHPVTHKANAGMYRMQILGRNSTAMHWQLHKTGAAHFREYKKLKMRMPVSVSLGGDPVYTYAATAPLPENIDEYILAGFLRGEKVRLVKCITNDLYVPYDADIVIEGYIDPGEEPVLEGPFGDHTGFYSLADWYPCFHVTCITHSYNAVYPATIVGIPPQEDAWLVKATEKIFLTPVRLTLLPEIEDFHMPEAGTAHNLVIVKIKKEYPGQGFKVINSLLGAGQLMFTKYLVVISGDTDIRNYNEIMIHVLGNTDPAYDIFFSRGPLDVLDHASDSPAFGGKAGIDATLKLPEELAGRVREAFTGPADTVALPADLAEKGLIRSYNNALPDNGIPVLIVSVDTSADPGVTGKLKTFLKNGRSWETFKVILVVDNPVDVYDYNIVTWQILSNSDPLRDHEYISQSCILIDGTIKAIRPEGFPREWPNIVCSDPETIKKIDTAWPLLAIGDPVRSPSLEMLKLLRDGTDKIIPSGPLK
jgi:4-hydroxy-3-polyprenylbenzoate decarboxylase